MKKIYLSFLFLLSVAFAQAQCTANVSCLAAGKTYGFCPDTLVNLDTAYVNHPYSATISFKVPSNGADWGYPLLAVTKVEIYKSGSTSTYADGFSGLPPGISTYQCSGSNGKCEWNGGTNGCMVISGTPTTVGTYKVFVYVKAYAGPAGSLSLIDTVRGYNIVVKPESAGLRTLATNKFEVSQNIPNPFNGETNIYYNLTKSGTVTFKVFDVLGKNVVNQTYRGKLGENEITFNSSDYRLKPGIYIYTLTNGETTLSRRMIVND